MTDLQPGDTAPAFTVNDQNGNKVSLKDFKGKKVVLYTYPKDSTATCTVEACNVRDNYKELTDRGIVVLGVSPDDEASHKKFEKKNNLPFTLLADPKMKILAPYGVYGEKQMFGNKYMGIFRRTFLINEKGKIDHIIRQVKSNAHVNQIITTWGL
jgi:peroxiredoxin Q/BCP